MLNINYGDADSPWSGGSRAGNFELAFHPAALGLAEEGRSFPADSHRSSFHFLKVPQGLSPPQAAE